MHDSNMDADVIGVTFVKCAHSKQDHRLQPVSMCVCVCACPQGPLNLQARCNIHGVRHTLPAWLMTPG